MEDFLNSLLIIIVTYKEPYFNCKSFCSLLESLDQKYFPNLNFFIYDNSPTSYINSKNDINSVYQNINLTYNHDSSNAGLGVAYNKGAAIAKQTNKKWLLILDQDTDFPKNVLVAYFKAVTSNSDVDIFAPTLFTEDMKLISPSKYLFRRGFPLPFIPNGITSLKNITPINSGTLISLTLFNSVGGYNEKIRLDFSDHAFMDKVRQKRKFLFIINCKIVHNLSSYSVNTLDKEITRFRFFCEGAKAAGEETHSKFNYFIISSLRAIKLSYLFKDSTFLSILYKNWLFK